MSELFDMFETDAKKEAEGVVVNVGKASFTIGAMYKTNPRYMKALEKVTRDYKTQLQTETLSNDQAEEINMQVFVDTVLFDFDNVKDGSGKDIAYSKENAKALFAKLPRLYDFLSGEAQKASRFRAATVEANAGN